MRYPKLRELKEALSSFFSRAYTSGFPAKPHQPFPRFRGAPHFHEQDCTGCTACAQVCPTRAIAWEDRVSGGRGVREFTIRWDICICCGLCEANCLTAKGIILSRDFDLATTAKREDLKEGIEKELLLCSGCGEIVAPRDQIAWVAEKIGALAFSNPGLFLFYLSNLGLAMEGAALPKEDALFLRSDRIKIICPRCRREAAFKS